MSGAISNTNFNLPGQTGLYHGKVRDVYSISDDYLVMVATDRISAFDVILPRPIPGKGQVLNQLAEHFLEATRDIVPNWLLSVPDPNVSIGKNCQPFKLEVVIRGALVGHAWREYSAGKRELCGQPLGDGMQEYDLFQRPIITPATKAETGHDEDISQTDIIAQGLATAQQFDQLADYARQLFTRGQSMAAKQGLLLADTKYEFGLWNNEVYLIDEIHTPDSSRYFYTKSYQDYLADRTKPTPRHLSKEFVREWLLERGFNGQSEQTVPEMDDAFVADITAHYVELYEQLTGKEFEPAAETDRLRQIESSITKALEQLAWSHYICQQLTTDET